MEEVLKEWLEQGKKKVKEDEKLQKDLKDFDGIFQLDIIGEDSYHVSIKNGEIGELEKGKAESPRLSLASDAETLKAVMSGEMSAMKAFALRKIRLRGSFEDIIRLRKLLKTD